MVRFSLKTVEQEKVAPANGHADNPWDPSAGWRRDRDLVHEPGRLQMMALVIRQNGATFQDLRVKLGLEDVEVASHAKRLETAGLLDSVREIGGTGMVITFAATAKGREAMEAYCDWMRDILEGLPGSSHSLER